MPVDEDLMDQLIASGAISQQKFSVDPRPIDKNVPANFLQNLVFNKFMYTKQDFYEKQLKELGLMNDDAFELYYHYSNSVHASLYARSYTGYMSLYPGEDNLATLGLGGRRWGRIYVTKLCPDTTNVLTLPAQCSKLIAKRNNYM